MKTGKNNLNANEKNKENAEKVVIKIEKSAYWVRASTGLVDTVLQTVSCSLGTDAQLNPITKGIFLINGRKNREQSTICTHEPQQIAQ